jgi:hypothetical protein
MLSHRHLQPTTGGKERGNGRRQGRHAGFGGKSRPIKKAGMICINSENVRHLPSPFGGMKASGIGRDGGDYSFDFYVETKNVAVAYDTHKMPRIGA